MARTEGTSTEPGVGFFVDQRAFRRARLEDLRIVERVADRLAQRATKQRMVVNDNETVARHTVYPCGILT